VIIDFARIPGVKSPILSHARAGKQTVVAELEPRGSGTSARSRWWRRTTSSCSSDP